MARPFSDVIRNFLGKDPLLQNQKVLVVERSPFLTKLTAESPYSNRVSSLSNGAVEFMKSMD